MRPGARSLILLSIAYLGFTGCATITRGTTEAFVVKTEPSGAKVRLSSGETCVSPCTLEKKHKDNFEVFIEKPGYESTHVSVISQVAGGGAAGMAGNVFLGGLIGAAVDAGTGATKELVPNPLEVTLNPAGQGLAASKSAPNKSAGEDTDMSPKAIMEEHPELAHSEDSRKEEQMAHQTDDAPSPTPGSSPSELSSNRLTASLVKKVHESFRGSDYVTIDVKWRNEFASRTIEEAHGKLRISEKDTGHEALLPCDVEESIPPGESYVKEGTRFVIKDTSKLAWLLKAESSQLSTKFEPSIIAFADGSSLQP